jgi:hypothetical protein
MNVSKGLQTQLDNLEQKGFFRLSYPEKIELELVLKEKINKSCGTCVRDAMQRLIKKNKVKTPVIHFIGVKQ